MVWDCVIVGGGAAGLTAALVLGRARRRALVVDAGRQSNLPSHGVGGLLGHDGRSPAELYEIGRRELSAYPTVEVRTGEVVTGARVGEAFELTLADGAVERARRVLLATGMEYRPAELSGVEKLWGTLVFHCPFCDGWEMRDRPLGVLARGERAVHMALLLLAWTADVVVCSDGPAELDDDDRARLEAAGVRIDERPLAEVVSRQPDSVTVVFADGDRLERGGLLASTTLHQRSGLAEALGAELEDPSPYGETPVKIDSLCRTTAPGVFAAGDCSAQVPQVASAISTGAVAAEAVVQSLLADERGLPFPAWPTPATTFWEQRYGERERIWSGRVNIRLAEVASELPPGRALDLGCGEGGDAMWLAEQGWDVVAVDVSETALQRAAEDAETRKMLHRIDFRRVDLAEFEPDGAFDLVSAQFLHSPVPLDRPAVLRRAAAAVAPGGLLLIVDHGAPPPWAPPAVHAHVFPGAEEVVAALDLDAGRWERLRVEAVERAATGPGGEEALLTDNLIVLRRVGGA